MWRLPSLNRGARRAEGAGFRVVRKRLPSVLTLEQLEDRAVPAAIPTATISGVPTEVLLGQTGTFTVTFDNTSPTDTGYGPYVNLYLPATGADGGSSAPNDGITFVSATYLGAAVNATVLTLTAAGVPHPYAKTLSGQPLIVTPPPGFQPGDQLVVLEVPYGSFTPDQPPAAIQVTAALSNLADVNVPLPIRAEGGFRFGNDALDNPTADPSITGPGATATTAPTLFKLTKTYIGPEDETTTGPNFPRQYQISVDIADGQTLTNLDLTDILPPELQFVSVVSTTPAATITSTPSTTAPGGTLTANFASVTGTAGPIDAQMTFSFYVPRVTGPLSPIIDPTTGDDTTAIDDASTSGTWDPIDPRDPATTVTSDATANDHTLTLKSIATQKTSNIVNDVGAPGLSPGDTVEYTINFQISDYFAFQNLVLTDLFSDGQNYVPLSAFLSVTDGHGAGGSTSGAFALANIALSPNFTGGSDQLLFFISQELAARGFSTDGRLVGGAIPAGGGSPVDGPTPPFGPTQGTITFRTIVQDAYEVDFPSGDSSLDQGDSIGNNVTISGDLLDVNTLQPNSPNTTEADTSSTTNTIATGSFTKTVYAINGVLNTSSAPPLIAPGDTVTYRLTYTLPTGDVENFQIEDYLPLPIFDVDTTGAVTVFDPLVSAIAPAAGRAQYGPADTSFARTNAVPIVSTNSGSNSVLFNFGTYDDPQNLPTTIEILFTVTVSADPFADNLLLSNGAQVRSNNTVLDTITGDGIAQVVTEEPVLSITKGIVATNNPTGAFSAPVGPVAFNAPGTAGPRFTGTINSTNLAAAPINSNLSNVDQGDLVTFAVVVENTGSGPNGAFDVLLRDSLPEGFVLPPGGINLRVTDGAGNLIPFDIVSNGTFDQLGGIQLRDPSATRGAIGPGVVNGATVQDGSNIVIVTFDLLTSGNRVNQLITDVATLSNYAASEGGPNFVPGGLTDDAQVRIAAPTMTKELVGTEIVNTTNANDEAVIGELVTYRIRLTVPEGTTPDAQLVDTLDQELAFVSQTSVTLPANVLLDGGSSTPTITNNGRTITWGLGNLVNNNASNGTPEVIEFLYRVVVVNTAASNANDLVNNGAQLTYAGGNPVSAAAPNVRIIEPQVQIDKSVNVDNTGTGNGDAGDPFVYTITLRNAPGANQFTADAFDLTFSDLFATGQLGSPLTGLSFTVTDTAGIVTNANFELVPDPANGNRLVLRTRTGGDFDLPVSSTRTITLRVTGTIANTVTVGQVIPNNAEVRWTSLDGNPGQRSTFTPDSTERTGTGGINDYRATDGADINIFDVDVQKFVVSTSENATTDPSAVVVGEIVRYRVQVAIPEFGTPTSFQFADLLPAGMQFVSVGTGTIAFVTDGGDMLTSTTLVDPDPNNPPDLYLTGDQNNVATLVPQFIIPLNLLTFTTVNGRSQVTFDLGLVTNPPDPTDPTNDLEFVIAEFNVLVTNTAGNQAGTALVNQVSVIESGTTTSTVVSPTLRVAEPNIFVEDKLVVSPTNPNQPATGPYDAGDRVGYRVDYANGVGANVSTAYDVRLIDTPPSAKMVVDPASIVVLRNGAPIATGFTNNSTATTVDVTLDVVAPGDVITVLYNVTLTAAVRSGEIIPNTANVTWTSLPGARGTLVNPTGAQTPGASGAADGERNGADGAGGALNDYAGTASANISITAPDLDKNILDTSFGLTGSNQFNPSLVDLTIGETVTYRLTITVPEGTSTLNLTDFLPTMTIGTVVFTSAQVVSIGGNISGSALAAGAPGTVSGTNVNFNFGTVINSPDNVSNELDQIVVDIVGQVTDLPENVSGTQVTNTAVLDYGTGTVTDSATADIVEPALDIQKNVAPASGDAGDVFTYTLTVTHLPTSTAAATALLIEDLLNTGNLVLVAGSVVVNGPLGYLVTSGNGAGDTVVRVIGADLLLGQTLTITYQARVTGAPLPGGVVPNTATLDYSSLREQPGSRHYDDQDPAEITVFTNTISGVVYRDANNNGVYEPGTDTLITAPVTMRLTGTDHLGNPVSIDVMTAGGAYTFTSLRPGTYTVTQVDQPAGFLDGRDTPGTSSPGTQFGGTGTAATAPRNPRDADAITGIVIGTGQNKNGINYNFGEILAATLGDFVWEDANGNGRQDAGESGINNVTVALTGTDDTGNPVTRTTQTGLLGAYTFDNLRPGTYQLTFTAPSGYVFTVRDSAVANDTTDSDATPGTGQTVAFALAQGQTDLTRDAGLYRPASVGDFVWYDVDTDGVQDSGEPGIPNVTVTLDDAGLDGTFGTADDVLNAATQQTTSTGAYLFANLRPGTYRVRVNPLTLPNGIVSQTYDFDGIATADRATTTLASGQNNLDVDFGYTVPVLRDAQLGDLVWYDLNLDGSFVGEPGIQGVTVTATWFGFDAVEGTADDVVFTDVTDASGVYGFNGIPLGEYRVTVDTTTLPTPPGAVVPSAVPTYDLDSGTTAADSTTRVTLTAARPRELGADFGYFELTAFGDTVYLDVNGNGAQDPGEPGLGNVTVRATWAGNDDTFGTTDDVVFTRTTNANGLYLFAGIPVGQFLVEVLTNTLPPAVTNTADPDGVLDGTTTFRQGSPQLRLDVDFGYQGNNSLSGYVYRDFDVDGLREPTNPNPETGIAGVTITLNAVLPTGATFTLSTVTAADGSYFFDGLPDGAYLITETQPPSVFQAGRAGYYDGLDTLGSAGGTRPAKNQFAVAFTQDIDGVEYNFGENPPADPFGFVYVDQNQNGTRDPGEPGIPGVAITVSGTAFPGTALQRPLTAADIPGGALTVFTDANGRWEFPVIPPGVYSFVETQPAGYADGAEQNADPNPPFTVVVGNDRFDNVVLNPFPVRGPFNFGEIQSVIPVPPVTPPMPPDVINKGMFLTSTMPGALAFMPTSPQYTNSVARLGVVTSARSIGVAVGADAGTIGVARLFDFATATERVTVVPFGGFLGGVRVAAGDVTGDGIDDLVTTMGPGGAPVVAIFDGSTGGLVSAFFALPPGLTGGLNVTTGDVTGDGRAEVIVGTATGVPIVAVYDGLSGGFLSAFVAFGGFPVGVTVAAGDVTGDGRADIVTGAASGVPMVFVYDGATNAQLSAFFAFPPALGSGVNVAVADVFGTGRPQIVATLASVPAPVVATFDVNGTMTSNLFVPGIVGNGMRVATADINGDGASDLVLGAGPGSTHVSIMSGRDFAMLDDFYGISPFGVSGVFVG